jgi:hypothetical protein
VVHLLGFALLAMVAQGDSQSILRWAQRAQSQFEISRQARLPSVPARPASRCDALRGDQLIGRFCFWDDGATSHPPPEPASIKPLRQRLLRVLDSAAALLPGDEWIAGQRVRYLVEGGQHEEALSAAHACRADPWWCAALAGFALHAAGDAPAAERAFTAALSHMPRAERCRWNDLSPLLSGELRQRYRQQTCEQRAALEASLWLRAQPLFSRPGNDRRVEHYARHTVARLLVHAQSPFGRGSGDDLRELVVRYGWPIAWAQERPEVGATDRRIVGYGREPTYHFLANGTRGAAEDNLDAERARELYAPAYATTFTILDPEVLAFRRGDSTLVVGVYDVAQDTLLQSRPLGAALALARGESDSMVVERRDGVGPAGVLIAMAPWPATLASLEVTAGPRAYGRARVALPERDPDARYALSDLLVFEPPDSLPRDLEDVLPHVRGAGSVPRGSRLGLYWEAYGLAPAEAVAISVSVQAQDRGLLKRVAESVGLATKSPPLQLEWEERVRPQAGRAPRALEIDVSTLEPGRYRIEVAVTPAGRAPASTSREIRVVLR